MPTNVHCVQFYYTHVICVQKTTSRNKIEVGVRTAADNDHIIYNKACI